MKRLLRACALVSAPALVLLPTWASACPSCAASGQRGAEVAWLVLLTLSPVMVGGALALLLRRAGRTGAPDGPGARR